MTTDNTLDETIEETETTEAAATAEEAPETVEAREATEDTGETPSAREARYRRRLRDTEAERDTLADRVKAYQTAEAEEIAGKILTKPAGLWAVGTTLDDVLDDTGNVDAGKVTKAAEAAAETAGLMTEKERLSRGDIAPSLGNRPSHGPMNRGRFSEAFGPQQG